MFQLQKLILQLVGTKASHCCCALCAAVRPNIIVIFCSTSGQPSNRTQVYSVCGFIYRSLNVLNMCAAIVPIYQCPKSKIPISIYRNTRTHTQFNSIQTDRKWNNRINWNYSRRLATMPKWYTKKFNTKYLCVVRSDITETFRFFVQKQYAAECHVCAMIIIYVNRIVSAEILSKAI